MLGPVNIQRERLGRRLFCLKGVPFLFIFQWVVLLSVIHAEGGVSTNGIPHISSETYILMVGDRLDFRVIEDGDPSRLLVISPTGEIDVPYYGRVQVTGKTLIQAGQIIKSLLEKDLYYRASVILALDETAPKMGGALGGGKLKQIYVVGQVRMQGSQDIGVDEKLLISRAIVKAGGFGSFANGRKVKIIRKLADGKKDEIIVDVLSVLKEGKTENDVELKPDDMVIVPEKLINF